MRGVRIAGGTKDMAGATIRRSAWLGWCAVLLGMAGGCQSIRLPAIDPTGQRLFLPPPAYTTLVHPELPECQLPRPAFSRPERPGPCPEGAPAPVTASGAAPCTTGLCPQADSPVAGTGPKPLEHHGGTRYGRLVLQPGRVVAPTGSEVVLVAGLCDPDGNYVVGQMLEWVLSQESVGHFVDAGQTGWSWLPASWQRTRKSSNNFLITRTSARAQVYTRGTAAPSDDFQVRRGQAWVSVTSPSEGTSYVTVWAPQAEGWDIRRQTAVIHWVDAQWQLPPPAVVAAGQAHTLRTRVTRSSGAPAEGWRVRYQWVDGPAVGLGQPGVREAIVPVDAQGDASINVLPETPQPGITRIRIQIVRPGRQTGEPPELVLGEGWTSISWSAPGLAVQVRGPSRVAAGETIELQVLVSNSGDLYARNVFLTDQLPPTWERLDAVPPAQPMGDVWQWNLGDIAPGDTRQLVIRCRALRDGLARYCVQATAEGGAESRGCVDVDVFTVRLSLRVTGPDSAVVGQRVTYQIEIANTGNTPLTNVTLIDQFDVGLRHSEGQASPIERPVGTLQPGEKRSDLAVSFVVVQPGRWCHTVEAVADGGQRARVERCLTATLAAGPAQPAETPRLQVRKTGPQQLEVGQTGLFVIEIRNAGAAPIQGLRISDRYDRALRPVQATTGAVASEGGQTISWTVSQLPPGAVEIREVECRAVRPSDSAASEVTVTTTEGLQEKAQMSTRVTGEAPRESVDLAPPMGPNGSAAAALRANLIALDNPVRAGQPTRLLLEIQNLRSEPDRQVIVTFLLPPDVRVQRVAGPGVTSRLAGNVLRFEPVAELRPGETLRPPYEVELVATKPGKITVKAQVESLRAGGPLEVERSIDVNP
ncbi:MAG: hypothetical protein KatS3mg110_3390 [Pirellulaceae bacterium]|nr:MAG: hypothetical protein KatS3mg110_3390 [Pirellulaceae bacterium]